MMQAQETKLCDVRIFPYYRGIPLEVEPVIKGGDGRYVVGQLLSQTYHALSLDHAEMVEDVHVGATYSCSAVTEDGSPLKTHWLYCTSVEPVLTFGITQNLSQINSFAPMMPNVETPLVQVEELTDLVATFPSPLHAVGLAQAQIGHRGWLVMTRVNAPDAMGLSIESPSLPPAFCEGTSNIMISAKSVRTLQTISFGSLTCVSATDPALFLQQES
ncbi:MAG: hypothetical protein WA790_15495 [Sulfitobacter sp.]